MRSGAYPLKPIARQKRTTDATEVPHSVASSLMVLSITTEGFSRTTRAMRAREGVSVDAAASIVDWMLMPSSVVVSARCEVRGARCKFFLPSLLPM